nr:undecaprenyl/decaprenyl-phosphate alpha-N-acetylglucosaminyl 1-phosphate transferase [Candidatus Aenigmarchaeota archaeon]
LASLMIGRTEVVPLALILTASSLGFLRYNFYPASIFMGDSGSLFLGFNLAAISVMGTLKSTATFSLLVPILILAIPIFDTFLAILRRVREKRSVFKPDREHFHHKLLDFGLSQKQTVLFIYFLTFVLGGIGLITIKLSRTQAIFVFGTTILVLAWIGMSCGAIKLKKKK